VNDEKLLNILNNHLEEYYNTLKESYEDTKSILYDINSKLNIYNKFLGMSKTKKDFYKKNVQQFYYNNVMDLLLENVDDIVENIDEVFYDIEVKRLDHVLESDEDTYNQINQYITHALNKLHNEKESVGNLNVYSEEINIVKRLLKSLNSKMFYEDETSFNNIVEYVTKNNINNKNELLNCIKTKRNEYLEKQKLLEKERKQRKKLLEQQNEESKKLKQQECKQILNTKNIYKFNYEDFLNKEDLELIKSVNEEIYKSSDVLSNINDEIVKLIKESLTFKELNIDLDSIIPNYNISNYNNIVILYEIRKILDSLNKIFEHLKVNNTSTNNLDIYKMEVFNHIFEIDKLYSDYVIEEQILEQQIKNINEKHIIYITNSSNEAVLKSDIKNLPENYKYFIDMLEDLKSGVISNNHEKDVRFTNNGKLGDVCKKKKYCARLVYCPCDDCYIVFAGFIKKNSNNNYELNLVKNRYSLYKNTIDNIINDLSDSDKKAKLIEENDKVHNELIDFLKTNSRAKKKELKNKFL